MYNEKSYAALFFDELDEYQELEVRLLEELQKDENNPHILNNLGVIHFESGDIDKAEEYLVSSDHLGNRQALETLCDLYSKTERVDKAIDSIYSMIKTENDIYKVGVYHRTIARYYVDSNSIDKAIEEYNKSLEIDPSFNNTYLLMAECLEEVGQKERGREYRVKYGKSKKL